MSPADSEECAYLALLGRRIQRAREIHGLTQDDLASLVKVHRNTISRIERGETTSLWNVVCIKRVFKQMQNAQENVKTEIFD